MERKQNKRNNESTEEMAMKKNREFKWEPKYCAQPIGKLIKFSGEGENKKCHYEKFKFHANKYNLEDSVLLIPEDSNKEPYVAIIKDIYVQGKEGYVKLEVQWFYRPGDVDKKYVRNWESKDSRNLFYSFHRDEVSAESVKKKFPVYFVPKNKQIPNPREHPGFIVQNVYDAFKKKMRNFTDKEFDEQEKDEINLLLVKTTLILGNLPNIEKKKTKLKSIRKKYVPKRSIMEVESTSLERSNEVNAPDYKYILKKFDMLSGDSDRDKRLEELLDAVKHECRISYCDFFWRGDAIRVVRALDQVIYEYFGKDITKYNHKLEELIDKLKISRVLARRLFNGQLKPEQVINMTPSELTSGFTFDEMKVDFKEPI